MTVIVLATRVSKLRSGRNFQDVALQAGAIAINQDAYSAGLDRVIDIRGLSSIHIEIKNTGGSNGLTYKIEKATVDYSTVSDLGDADFAEDVIGDTNVAFGGKDVNDIIDVTPEGTAIRIRVKRQTSAQDTTLAGVVSAT